WRLAPTSPPSSVSGWSGSRTAPSFAPSAGRLRPPLRSTVLHRRSRFGQRCGASSKIWARPKQVRGFARIPRVYHGGVQVAIYADRDPGGKKLIATIQRRLKNEEIRAWQVQKKAPFTLVHSGDRYTKIRVTFVPSGTPTFSRAARAG